MVIISLKGLAKSCTSPICLVRYNLLTQNCDKDANGYKANRQLHKLRNTVCIEIFISRVDFLHTEVLRHIIGQTLIELISDNA